MNQESILILCLLAKFQALEASIKIYIGKTYLHIQSLVDEPYVFNHSYEDIKQHSLERAFKIFSKLNNDDELKTDIKKLISIRDHCAHKALLIASTTLPSDTKKFFLGHDENSFDFSEVNNRLDTCIEGITNHLKAFLENSSNQAD